MSDKKRSNPQNLAIWYKHQNPDCDFSQPLNSERKIDKLKMWLFKLFIVKGEDLHGTSFVPRELDLDAKQLALAITIANIINAVTAYPLILMSVNNLPFGLGYPLSGGLMWLLLIFSNTSGSTAATGRKNSRIALLAWILLNILQSAVGGIGTKIILDAENNATDFAHLLINQEIIEVKEKQLEKYQNDDFAQLLKKTNKRCDELKHKLEPLPFNHPKRGPIYSEAYGSYSYEELPLEQRPYYNTPKLQWPLCPRANAFEDEQQARLQGIQDEIKQINDDVIDLGARGYLKEKKLILYEQKFDDKGLLKSGMDSTAISIVVFMEYLVSGQWQRLGLSFYLFLLSIITSVAAVWLTASYANNNENLQMSYSEEIAEARDKFFLELWKQVYETPSALILPNENNNHSNGYHQNPFYDSNRVNPNPTTRRSTG